jgi:hypothetical protein
MEVNLMTTATKEHHKLESDLVPFYKASVGKPSIINVPEWSFLMIDGRGDPRTSMAYKDAIEALYSVSYTLKFALKKILKLEYKVYPLEGLWWSDNIEDFVQGQRDLWKWTMMIAQPLEVTREHVAAAIEQVEHKKVAPGLEHLHFEHFREGMAAQVLHVGPYAAEAPTIIALHTFIREHGGQFNGLVHKHHEIYLSDPNRAAPEKLKTIIRQPFIPV